MTVNSSFTPTSDPTDHLTSKRKKPATSRPRRRALRAASEGICNLAAASALDLDGTVAGVSSFKFDMPGRKKAVPARKDVSSRFTAPREPSIALSRGATYHMQTCGNSFWFDTTDDP